MAAEKVRGTDQTPEVAVNADSFAGTYRVTAEGGVTVDGLGFHKQGAKVELNGDAARALLNDGSVERA